MAINLKDTRTAIADYAASQIDRHGIDGQVADVYAATCADIIDGLYTLDAPIALEMVKWAAPRGLIKDA